MRSTLLESALLASSLFSLSACGGYTQNVRAYRAYAYESPSLAVALDRTEDIGELVKLVDKLLFETPYSPGDAWVKSLAPTDEVAKQIRDELSQQQPYTDGGFHVPVAKIYRVHLERVIASAPSSGKYPSILDAMGGLADDAKDIKTHWKVQVTTTATYLTAEALFEKKYAEAYPPGTQRRGEEPSSVSEARKARDDAKTEMKQATARLNEDIEAIKKAKGDNGSRGELLKDLTVVVSVGYRADLEALAMVPIVASQVFRLIPKLARGSADLPSVKGVKQLADVPAYIDGVKEKMSRQAATLDLMTETLAAASKTTVEETAGFAMKDSVVDSVVGVTYDSLRIKLHAGAEAFFFSAIRNSTDPNAQQNTDSGNKTTKDYSGHLRELRYDVKPILLAAMNLNIGFDYIQLPNAANLSLGYKTDRAFSSGGNIDNSGSLSNQLGVKGVASDALDIGLGVLGVKTAVRIATFTAGTVHYTDPTGNDILLGGKPATAPFQINYTQIDVGYDIAFLMGESAGKYYIEELTVGARYFQYALPRILYELENQAPPGGDTKTFTYFSESAPQVVTSKYYMGGATARFGAGPAPWISPFGDLGIYVGYGPSAYFMRKTKPTAATVDKDTNLTDASKQSLEDKTAVAANAVLAAGARLRLHNSGGRFKLSAEAQYRAELIFAQTSGSGAPNSGKEHIVDFGGADLFHGPRLNLVGEF